MKNYPVHIRLHPIHRTGGFRRLTGSKTNNRPLLIIIILTTVLNGTSLFHLQKQRIQPVMHRHHLNATGRLIQIHNTHQRMERFQPKQPIIHIHTIQMKHFTHIPSILRLP